MRMTHKQIVEEWKEQYVQDFGHEHLGAYLAFLEAAMLAAAKETAEAGTVKRKSFVSTNPVHDLGFNAAISQSEHQLAEHFNESA
jgi:basic membrane lipoprotein Med (substrate-binding protein (PBP1-ABC) superfamily)